MSPGPGLQEDRSINPFTHYVAMCDVACLDGGACAPRAHSVGPTRKVTNTLHTQKGGVVKDRSELTDLLAAILCRNPGDVDAIESQRRWVLVRALRP